MKRACQLCRAHCPECGATVGREPFESHRFACVSRRIAPCKNVASWEVLYQGGLLYVCEEHYRSVAS